MKNTLRLKHAFFITLMVAICMGCEKKDNDEMIDSDDGNDISGSIEGTWELTELSYSYKVGPMEATSVGADISNVLLDINADGTTSGNGKKFTIETSIGEASGSTSTQSELILNEGRWEQSGDTFTWTGQGDSRDFTIEKLTDKSLHLKGDFGNELAFGLFNKIDLEFSRKN